MCSAVNDKQEAFSRRVTEPQWHMKSSDPDNIIVFIINEFS